MSTEPETAEHREIPVETLRAWYVDECELASVRQVATAAGIGRTTLHKFVSSDREPHPRTRRLLALYFMRMRGSVDEQRAADARTAFTILAGFFPPEARERIAAELLDVTERGFEREGLEVPGWIALLREGGGHGS
jgi:hypothetical protein